MLEVNVNISSSFWTQRLTKSQGGLVHTATLIQQPSCSADQHGWGRSDLSQGLSCDWPQHHLPHWIASPWPLNWCTYETLLHLTAAFQGGERHCLDCGTPVTAHNKYPVAHFRTAVHPLLASGKYSTCFSLQTIQFSLAYHESEKSSNAAIPQNQWPCQFTAFSSLFTVLCGGFQENKCIDSCSFLRALEEPRVKWCYMLVGKSAISCNRCSMVSRRMEYFRTSFVTSRSSSSFSFWIKLVNTGISNLMYCATS